MAGVIRCILIGLAAFFGPLEASLYATEPPAPTAPIVVAGPSRPAISLTIEDLARLPTVQFEVPFLTAHGMRVASFEGPLLWTVLKDAGAVDPARLRDTVSQSIVIVGRGGYRATLALGEIAPDFEGKRVLLAERMNEHPLGQGHLRIVVPLDKNGGRGVRDVMRIEVSPPQ